MNQKEEKNSLTSSEDRRHQNSEQELLNALDDPEVQKKIKRIIGAELMENRGEPDIEIGGRQKDDYGFVSLKKENERLRADNRRLQEENQRLQQVEQKYQEIAGLQEEYGKLKASYQTLQGSYDSISKRYERYQPLDEYYDAYIKLDREIRDSLKNLFSENDALSFLFSGTGERKLETFWDFVSYQYGKQDFETLSGLFSFFFWYTSHSVPELRRQEPEPGESYDDTLYQKTPDSPMRGRIKEIIFPGYQRGEKIIRKSIVQIG